jgi:hypothetical protein
MKMAMLFLLMAASARADSVDTTDKLTTNGQVQRMDQKELVLKGRFKLESGAVETREVTIPRSQVVKIEFNANDFNPGKAAEPGGRPPVATKAQAQAALESQDVLVLWDGSRQPCDGATIDGQQRLFCGKQETPKAHVVRILLARR